MAVNNPQGYSQQDHQLSDRYAVSNSTLLVNMVIGVIGVKTETLVTGIPLVSKILTRRDERPGRRGGVEIIFPASEVNHAPTCPRAVKFLDARNLHSDIG
ncbi:hypothetical protein [Nonomuraea sediminis]|uniref:hypothetical protein n=1 Tax=Nonomuraea sediminis TaxID=2835864 RepID=UPI001BDD0443|nr:hypothetical protein [Nonomuraea sediminis]